MADGRGTAPGDDLHVIGSLDDVAGYAISEVRGSTGTIIEGAFSADTAPAVLAAISTQWRDAGVTDCSIAVPALAADRAVFASFAPEARSVADATGMTRPLRRPPRLGGIRHFTGADYF